MDTKGLKILLIALIALLMGFLVCAYKIKCDNNARRFYKQGMQFYNNKNYSDAYYNFSQIKKAAKLYKLALLKQFQCANMLTDKKTAYAKLSALSKIIDDSPIRPYVLYNEALLAQELKIDNDNKLYRKFSYIEKTYQKNDFAIASSYKIAKIKESSDKEVSKNNYIKYLAEAPNGKYALDALDSLSKLDIRLSKDEWGVVGDSYIKNAKFEQAKDAYLKSVFSKNWVNLSRCYKGLGNFEEEKNTIIRGLEFKYGEIDEKEIDYAIDRLIFITKADKIQTLQNLYTKFPKSYILPTVAYKLAESTASIRSIKLYELVATSHPDSIWASNSMWEVFWYNYSLSRYQVCEQLAKIHAQKYPNTQDAPRIMYWYGRALLKNQKNQEAKEIFYKLIDSYPLSYYSFLSARQLKMSKAKKMIIKKPVKGFDINNLNKFLFKDEYLQTLALYNDFQTIDELKINDEYIKSWVYNKKEMYPKSITTARDEILKTISEYSDEDYENAASKVNFSNPMLKLMYPVFYEKEINKYAQEFSQSPYLFLSLVKEESHFDKNAKSSVGALGLSQLMPATANFIEKTTVSKDTLLMPEENIRIGLKYFTYLVNYFKGSEYLAILAYNAGPGNISKWINDPNIESGEIDVFVENIPYLETKNYIKKILSTYWVYINLYSPKNKN